VGDLLFVIVKYSQFCSISVNAFNFKFLLKVDGDSFVRLGALLKSLRDIEHPKLYWGFLDGRARPFAKGKWLEEEWRLCDYYLPYQVKYLILNLLIIFSLVAVTFFRVN
jgi:hypothetical protein